MRLPLSFLTQVPVVLMLAACGQTKLTNDGGGGHDDGGIDWGRPAIDAGADGAPGGPPHLIQVRTLAVATVADGLCSLDEAVAAVNARTTGNGDCPAGTGNDAIVLPAGTFEMTKSLEPKASVEIRGAGMDATTIAFGGQDLRCGVNVATVDARVHLTSLTLRPTASSGASVKNLTGVCATGGTVRIRHLRVTAFTAGGLRVEAPDDSSAKLEIYNSLIDGNRSDGDGAGVAFLGPASSISIDQASIINNISGGMGGGLWAAGGSNANYIYHTTFSGNVARRGGGIAAHVLPLTYFGFYWSTLVQNHATDIGGGLYIEGPSLDSHGTATASIIAGNTADGDPTQGNLNDNAPPGFSCTSSLMDIARLTHPPLNLDQMCLYDAPEPRLGPLMDMGGVDHLPVHPLLPGSVAIDGTGGRIPDVIVEQRDGWNDRGGDPLIGSDPGDTPAWTLFGNVQAGKMRDDQGAYEYNPRWEVELLAVEEVSGGVVNVVAAADGRSHGAATHFRPGFAGDFVVLRVPVPEAGTHTVTVQAAVGGGRAPFQVWVADSWGGAYRPVGQKQDARAGTTGWRVFDLGTATFASPGQKYFRVVADDAQSDGSGPPSELVLDFLTVTRQ